MNDRLLKLIAAQTDGAFCTRREMLVQSGWGWACSGWLRCSARRQAGDGIRESAGPQAAALPGQGEAHHPYLLERRPVARRHVRPQAHPGKIRGQAAAQREPPNRAKDRGGLSLAVQIQKVRPERDRNQRDLFASRPACRRLVRHPLDARGRSQSRTFADADELRRSPRCRGPASARGSPTDWDRKPEPARVRRPVPARLSDQGHRELAVGVSAGQLPGDLRRHAVQRRSTS